METEGGAPAEGQTPLEALFAAVRAGNVVRTEAALASLEARQALEANEMSGIREGTAPQSYWGGLWAATGGGARSSSPGGPALPPTSWLDEARDTDGHTALHWAALEGHTGIVRRLLQAGTSADVRSRGADQLGQTPLMWAVVGGHLEVVRLLVEEAGSDAAAVDARGYSPMVHAVQYGYIDIVHWLSQLGRAPGGRTGRAAEPEGGEVAALAPGYEDPEITATATDEASECVWVRDAEEHTLLHWAAYREQLALVQYLMIYHGLDPNACDASGNTPLHRALQRNHFRVARALLRRGALDTIRNKSGLLPHELAREKGYRWLSAYVLEWSRLGREPPPYSETCIRVLTRNKAKEVHASASGGGSGDDDDDQDARADERDSPRAPPLRARWLSLALHLRSLRAATARPGLLLLLLDRVLDRHVLPLVCASTRRRALVAQHSGERVHCGERRGVAAHHVWRSGAIGTGAGTGAAGDAAVGRFSAPAGQHVDDRHRLGDIPTQTRRPVALHAAAAGDGCRRRPRPSPAELSVCCAGRHPLGQPLLLLFVSEHQTAARQALRPPGPLRGAVRPLLPVDEQHHRGAQPLGVSGVAGVAAVAARYVCVHHDAAGVFHARLSLRRGQRGSGGRAAHHATGVRALGLPSGVPGAGAAAGHPTGVPVLRGRLDHQREHQLRAVHRGLCGCGAAVWSALSGWCRRSVHAGKYRLLGKHKRTDGTGDASAGDVGVPIGLRSLFGPVTGSVGAALPCPPRAAQSATPGTASRSARCPSCPVAPRRSRHRGSTPEYPPKCCCGICAR
eukprot:ctg_662.g249